MLQNTSGGCFHPYCIVSQNDRAHFKKSCSICYISCSVCYILTSFSKNLSNNLFVFSVYQPTEAVARRCSVKKAFLGISQNSQENACSRVSFLIKLQAKTCNFIKKEALPQVFSCEFCEISKNTFSYRTPPVAASQPMKSNPSPIRIFSRFPF